MAALRPDSPLLLLSSRGAQVEVAVVTATARENWLGWVDQAMTDDALPFQLRTPGGGVTLDPSTITAVKAWDSSKTPAIELQALAPYFEQKIAGRSGG